MRLSIHNIPPKTDDRLGWMYSQIGRNEADRGTKKLIVPEKNYQ